MSQSCEAAFIMRFLLVKAAEFLNLHKVIASLEKLMDWSAFQDFDTDDAGR